MFPGGLRRNLVIASLFEFEEGQGAPLFQIRSGSQSEMAHSTSPSSIIHKMRSPLLALVTSFAVPSIHHNAHLADRSSNLKVTVEDDDDDDSRLPFDQRVLGPRPARRMNHAFRYLYRHGCNSNTTDAFDYLVGEVGFTNEQVVAMNQSFPMLLELSVPQQLYPKLQFLYHTLHLTDPSETYRVVPPQFFGARLERILAPHHAFLVWLGLPSGQALLEADDTGQLLWHAFLQAGRKSQTFAALCQTWKKRKLFSSSSQSPHSILLPTTTITARHVDAFTTLFSRGLLAAARNDTTSAVWASELLSPHLLPSADLLRLLLEHGANGAERDHRGATLLHWACGVGHWEGANVLLQHNTASVWDRTWRDGATPLHWAAAGVTTREFGVGGHASICEGLLEQVLPQRRREYVNTCTFDGNSALMWAGWSGTLETVKLLARHRADTAIANRNGCTVAHWAASGGSLEVCRYLADTMEVDFSVPNHGGNTPLTHAVAFGRSDVVEWLLGHLSNEDESQDDMLALSLAQDFVAWTDGAEERKKVLDLFSNDWNL